MNKKDKMDLIMEYLDSITPISIDTYAPSKLDKYQNFTIRYYITRYDIPGFQGNDKLRIIIPIKQLFKDDVTLDIDLSNDANDIIKSIDDEITNKALLLLNLMEKTSKTYRKKLIKGREVK